VVRGTFMDAFVYQYTVMVFRAVFDG